MLKEAREENRYIVIAPKETRFSLEYILNWLGARYEKASPWARGQFLFVYEAREPETREIYAIYGEKEKILKKEQWIEEYFKKSRLLWTKKIDPLVLERREFL